MHERLKFLLWKVAWNILPTRHRIAMNLQSSFQGDSDCLFFGASSETLHHLLFSCSYVRLLWRLSPWALNVERFRHSLVHDWIHCILEPSSLLGLSTCDCHSFQLFVVLLLDSVWMARNKLLHDRVQISPRMLLQQILHTHKEHRAAWQVAPKLLQKVKAPSFLPGNSLRMTFDVAIRASSSVSAVILFHSNGAFCVPALKNLSLLIHLSAKQKLLC
ncbi:hypothetical protein CJ030_MR2G022154 [Morella rubra]|uniref:Reverse transcriptase zinc-binding domain-containing protein n=1 Tax=Morella rubra TaxID=262757 RepID=A0A6A1WBT6_9ROSI|nr:hypothetical protein CJ030_MR2G022154 [Morella rubra]